MKIFFLMMMLIVVACNPAKEETKTVEAAPVAEEDCDEKAKKKVEIKEETISLTGDTGCSLDEVH